jgi:mono/diheme cytochrome c family protein
MQNFLRSAALAAALSFSAQAASAADEAQIKRGEYLFHAGGCESCHTDKKAQTPRLAGGPAIKTDFGTFYGPNITSHKERGIGAWTEADFIRAMRDGRSPSGAHYYPTFPYTSFTNITDTDLKDMWAYVQTVPPSDRASQPQEVSFPFSWRFLQAGWRMLEFSPGPFRPDPSKSAEVNRGAYLVIALTHCGECHTPRNSLGTAPRCPTSRASNGAPRRLRNTCRPG